MGFAMGSLVVLTEHCSSGAHFKEIDKQILFFTWSADFVLCFIANYFVMDVKPLCTTFLNIVFQVTFFHTWKVLL